MALAEDIGNFVKRVRVHALGMGFMTIAVMAAKGIAIATGFSMILPIIAIGGVVVTAFDRFYREGLYQDDMVNLYRNDIAKQLGIAPEEVNRTHLKEAAKENDVIGQALTRQRHKTWIAIGTAAVASLVTVGMVQFFGADSMLHSAAAKLFGGSQLMAGVVNWVGIGTVSLLSSLVFKGGLRAVIGETSGAGKAAAHDRIVQMEADLQHGRAITKERVYSVLVAANPQLEHSIAQQFHLPYSFMNVHQQATVLSTIGVAQEMQAVAQQINNGHMRPGELGSLMQGAAIDHETIREVHQIPGSHFVEKLGLAPKPNHSYREQIIAERQQLTEQAR